MDCTKLIKSLKSSNVVLIVFCVLNFNYKLKSQDIKSEFFQIKFISGYKYSGDLYLFTNLSTTVFRPYVLIDWGPQVDTLKFIQSDLYGNTVVNKFSGSYTYPGPGTYNIIYKDQLRLGGIKNIKNSQSEQTQITTTLIIDPLNIGNIGPKMQNYPIYFGKNGNQAFYDPDFIDSNGDSLSYSITNCFASNYYLPVGTALSQTGILSFSKDSIGGYAFSYYITEWRKDMDGNYFKVGMSQIDFVMDITSSIGITELPGESSLKIYPNPVSGILHISSEHYFEKGTEVEIINTLGQTVLKLNYSDEIDVSSLSQGCYTMKIISADKRQFHSKFLKD